MDEECFDSSDSSVTCCPEEMICGKMVSVRYKCFPAGKEVLTDQKQEGLGIWVD